MPRKKLTQDTDVVQETVPTIAAKPRAPRRKKEVAPEPALIEAPASPADELAPKGRSRRSTDSDRPTRAPRTVAKKDAPAADTPVTGEYPELLGATLTWRPFERKATGTAEGTPEPSEQRGRRGRRGGSRSTGQRAESALGTPGPSERKTSGGAPAPPMPLDIVLTANDADLPIPAWRSSPKAATGVADAPAQEQPTGRRRTTRTARVPKQREVGLSTEAAEVPPPVLKPIVPAPAGAPQIVLSNGIPTLVRNGRVYPPLFFFGNTTDESHVPTVFEEVKLAAEAGVHLHSFFVEFEIDRGSVAYAAKVAGYLLKKAIETDPEAQVVFRLVFAPISGWHERYPRGRYKAADGTIADPSVCDDQIWTVARECVESFIQMLSPLDTEGHILGIHLDRGEWFLPVNHGYDTSPAAKEKFRQWVRTRYRDDVVALRAAWFDGSVDFETLDVPAFQSQPDAPEQFVRAHRKERRWVDYHLFLSDATVERIADLAYGAKVASNGAFLVGVTYGYTFEWSHPGSGHLSLGKLLRTPEIDYIAGPPSYKTREPGGAAPFPGPIDSFALNGKLYVSEEDFKTSISGRTEPDEFNPVIKTPQALESIHWRGAGSALGHASGICWMDLWGNGWLKTRGIWQRAKQIADVLSRRSLAAAPAPDVAVFIDERALGYLVDQKGFEKLLQNVRESVLRSGMSSAFYLLSDLQHREHFPESKLYIFLNAWDIRPELRVAIKNRLQKDDKVLFWLYAAGLFDSGRESLERAREVTGIAIKPQPFHSKAGTTILNRRHPLGQAFPDQGIIGGSRLEPSYFAIPEEAIILGEYAASGLPSYVVREFRHDHDAALNWKSVFLGEPVVTPALVRALGQYAGAHIWNHQDDVVHARPPFLTVHCTGAGQRTIMLPNKWSAYNIALAEWQALDATNLRFTATDGSTHSFLVGPKEDLEALLNSDPADLLRMDVLPPKPDDTVRFDLATFDVPIMKLDEWMDFGDADDMSDDLLFKARLIEEEEEAPEAASEFGGRRRSKRRRPPQRGSDESSSRRRDGESVQAGDLEMNVVFRKRE